MNAKEQSKAPPAVEQETVMTEAFKEKESQPANTASRPMKLHERFNDWLQRRWWRFQYRRAHRAAFKIAAMGQDNSHPQTFLNVAKDNLYMAAREFDLMADNWQRGQLHFTPRKRPAVKSSEEK